MHTLYRIIPGTLTSVNSSNYTDKFHTSTDQHFDMMKILLLTGFMYDLTS